MKKNLDDAFDHLLQSIINQFSLTMQIYYSFHTLTIYSVHTTGISRITIFFLLISHTFDFPSRSYIHHIVRKEIKKKNYVMIAYEHETVYCTNELCSTMMILSLMNEIINACINDIYQ